MKKVILICMMFSTMMNYAADKKATLKPNTELIASWQYKTTYLSNGAVCTSQIDNYYFYSDNTCVKESKVMNCRTNIEVKNNSVQRYTIVGNNIVLLNEKGKQTAIFGTNCKVGNLLKGQKMISQTKELPTQKIEKSNNDQLAMNQ